ncbi:unconventional myosin-Ia isoform X2 [Adelges cooleyi]|nr:unconventional myosin-Ia isoform X2 [Adelges cooleyi]XP_050443709.1 unconventional myosin-Ia isoform X2 [Adelges cooleyi]
MDLNDEDGIWDSVLLDPLTEETFISNLSCRYNSNTIYTYMGNMLIAVNPHKEVQQMSTLLCQTYMSPRSGHLPPHLFAIAGWCVRWLVDAAQDQWIVLQGVSGSGKSYCTSMLLQCLCKYNDNNKVLNQRLLNSNILLQSFGNAKTHIHRDASRFIKHIDLEMNFKGNILGATFSGYLLDKSRVTSQNALNRNFHLFYQLIYGADIHLLKSLKLTRNSENYVYLKCSNRLRQLDIVNFQSAYHSTKCAFELLGISELDVISVFKIVSSILKLGNLTIVPTNNIDGTEGCIITNDYELYELGELLGMDGETLNKALTSSSSLLSEMSAKEARNAKDHLAQSLYSRLFSWLVWRINQCIKAEAKYKRRHLGILDAFGCDYSDSKMDWDSFVVNSCTDKIHNIVLSTTLKEEQQEYAIERLHWCLIPFYDNTLVCELIYKTEGGLLSTLDEFITDNNSLTILKRIYALQQLSESSSDDGIHTRMEQISLYDCFTLNHFIGPVKYNVNTFVEKNKNVLSPTLCCAMFNGTHPLLKELFPEGNPERVTAFTVSNPASQLRVWAEAFTATLSSRHLHYVTCLSPNRHCQTNSFDASFVKQQIRWFSLVEIVRLRRAGFCYRLTFEEFLNRYKMLSPSTWPRPRFGNTAKSIRSLVVCLPIPCGEFVYGVTKVFVRSPRSVWELEQLRAERLNQLAALVQEAWHKFKRHKTPCNPTKIYRNYKMTDTVLAAKCICRTFLTWQKRQYLFKLSKCLNHSMESPTSRSWVPLTNSRFAHTHYLLETLHHKWRCRKYRDKLDQTSRNRMREKVTASILFKNRKASYSHSVAHPFTGDYVRLRQHVQWKKTALQYGDQHVVFADIVNKITRSSGKFVPTLLVISTKSMLILDQRTLQVKYRVPAADIYQLSLSPFLDNVAVFHIKSAYVRCSEEEDENEEEDDVTGEWSPTPSGCLFHQGSIAAGPSNSTYKKKGDFVLQTSHVIEVVTKLFLVIQNVSGTSPDVNISTRLEANFGDQTVVISFKYLGMPEVAPGQIKIVRKTNKMEIFV